MRDSDLDRLLRSAAKADDSASTSVPFGFDTRVIASWRASARDSTRAGGELTRLVRRIVIAAAVVTVFSGVGAYWQLTENDDAAEPLTNAYALADTAIEKGVFQ
jgi:hypothetical protein